MQTGFRNLSCATCTSAEHCGKEALGVFEAAMDWRHRWFFRLWECECILHTSSPGKTTFLPVFQRNHVITSHEVQKEERMLTRSPRCACFPHAIRADACGCLQASGQSFLGTFVFCVAVRSCLRGSWTSGVSIPGSLCARNPRGRNAGCCYNGIRKRH